MSFRRLAKVLQDVRRSAIATGAVPMTDGQLLETFVVNGEEAGFEGLVRRYGPMVFGVCRRLLRHEHDAEDAFQATFVVLVRKAASLRQREGVGNWLYGVAVRTAMQARRRTGRRRVVEAEVEPKAPEQSAADAVADHEMQALLDQELSRLPDKFRTPIVLCDLMGKTMKQAAKELGWPEGTVSSRLTRGRQLLKARLSPSGASFFAATGALLLHQAASQAVPLRLVSTTVKSALLFFNGNLAAAGLSPSVASLVNGVMKSMLFTKLIPVAAVVFVLSLLGSAAGLVAWGKAAKPAVQTKERPASKADGVAVVNQAREVSKVEAQPPVPAKEKPFHLYGGKNFSDWRSTLAIDLKPEVRVEAIKALGAFGANGYAEEATAAIIDVMKKYDRAHLDSDNYPVVEAAKNTLTSIGPKTTTVPLKVE